MTNNNLDFCHIHCHSMHSLLDGAIIVDELIPYLKEHGMSSCALTDHGWMAGILQFYQKMKKAELKPLLGCETYITSDPDGLTENKTNDNHHLVIIAKNNAGFSTLMDLVSNGALNNFYYKPRINKTMLRHLKGNAIISSSCLGGPIAKKLTFETDYQGRCIRAIDETNGAIDREVDFFVDTFGEDFYLEVQGWWDQENKQQVYNDWLLEFAERRKLPLVIAADCHYLKEKDSSLHELLMAQQIGKTISEYKKGDFIHGPHFWVATPQQMLDRAIKIGSEQAFHNTMVISNKCNVELELGKYQEPNFDITKEDDYQEFLTWKKNRG